MLPLTPAARRYLAHADRSCVRCHGEISRLARVGEDDHYVLAETPLDLSINRRDSDAFVSNTVEVTATRRVGIMLCSDLHPEEPR